MRAQSFQSASGTLSRSDSNMIICIFKCLYIYIYNNIFLLLLLFLNFPKVTPPSHVIPHTIQMLLFSPRWGDRLNGLLSVFLMAVPWYYVAQPTRDRLIGCWLLFRGEGFFFSRGPKVKFHLPLWGVSMVCFLLMILLDLWNKWF